MKYQELFPIPEEWVQGIDESMASTVAGWAEAEVKAGRLEHNEDYDTLLAPAMRKLFVDIGLQAMFMPEAAGGGGLSTPDAAMTLAAALEQVGTADCGIGFLCANTLALQSTFSIEPHRDEALLETVAADFCGKSEAVGSLVLPYYGRKGVERARFHGLEVQASADESADGWVVSGKAVRPQCSGETACLFGVVCGAQDGEPLMLLVPGGSSGLSRGDQFKKTGLAASLNSDVTLEGVTVPAGNLAFRGAEGVREMLCWYYLGCAAVCCGAALASYEIHREWGETRVIKGKGNVFKENPLVAGLMGEIGGRTGISRILTYNLARMLSKPELYGPAGSQALFATATAVLRQVAGSTIESIDNIMEHMGSAGYATEWNLERYWRDVKTIETYVLPETATQVDMARHYYGLRTL